MKIERCADPDHHRLDSPALPGHPYFLFRAAESHENNTGAGGVDPCRDFPFFRIRQVTERRRMASGER